MDNNLNRDHVSAFIAELTSSVNSATMSVDVDQIAETIVSLDTLKRAVGDLLEEAKLALSDIMGDSPEISAGSFVFEKRQGGNRKAWDHKSISKIVADRITEMNIDFDTGEVVRTPSELIADAFQFAGVSYWRVKELQKIGVNADAYCEVTEAKPSIIIRNK